MAVGGIVSEHVKKSHVPGASRSASREEKSPIQSMGVAAPVQETVTTPPGSTRVGVTPSGDNSSGTTLPLRAELAAPVAILLSEPVQLHSNPQRTGLIRISEERP